MDEHEYYRALLGVLYLYFYGLYFNIRNKIMIYLGTLAILSLVKVLLNSKDNQTK